MAANAVPAPRYLCFCCPHCGKRLDRSLSGEVVKMTMEYRCPDSRGCGKIFEVHFREPDGFRTVPPQKYSAILVGKTPAGQDIIVAR
jgi:hypothetical protein